MKWNGRAHSWCQRIKELSSVRKHLRLHFLAWCGKSSVCVSFFLSDRTPRRCHFRRETRGLNLAWQWEYKWQLGWPNRGLMFELLCVTLTLTSQVVTAPQALPACQMPHCHLWCSDRNHEPWKTPYCFVMSPLECSECFGDQLLHRTYTWQLTLVWLFTWDRNNHLRQAGIVISASKTFKSLLHEL